MLHELPMAQGPAKGQVQDFGNSDYFIINPLAKYRTNRVKSQAMRMREQSEVYLAPATFCYPVPGEISLTLCFNSFHGPISAI